MKRTATFAIIAVVLLASCGKKDGQAELKLSEGNIDRIVQAMTLEEKCHYVVGTSQRDLYSEQERADADSIRHEVPGMAGTTFPVSRLGVPGLVFADGPAGLRISPTRKGTDATFYCTGFPVGQVLANTWDPAVVEEVGRAMGEEVHEYGVDVLLAPGMNIKRNPLCGRNFEYYSEDPLLCGKTGAAFVRGVQSNGVGTSIKHFCANNNEINRLYVDCRVSVKALREIYLKGFEIAVREGRPWTVMTSYNYLNGPYTSENPELLQGVLRDDWGFDGLVMTDWGGGQHADLQIAAGNDNIQSGKDWQYKQIIDAVNAGTLSVEALDKCVRRNLELALRAPHYKGYAYSNKPDLEAHAAVSRKAATEGMVLLQNGDEALPLCSGATVAMFGVGSYHLYAGGTGSGDVNKSHVVGLKEGLENAGFKLDAGLDAAYAALIKAQAEALSKANDGKGWWVKQLRNTELPQNTLQKAVKNALKGSDIALVTITRQAGEGTDRHVEDDFNLTAEEQELIGTVSAAFHKEGKKVVAVINSGGVIETASWKGKVDGILLAGMPGQEAGDAIVDILSGKVNPSGCLAESYPVSYSDVPSQNFPNLGLNTGKNDSFYRQSKEQLHEMQNVDYIDYIEGVYVGYRYYTSFGVPTSFPFGHGLSYTSFETSDLNASIKGKTLTISAKITNTGKLAGRKVVQVYLEREKGCGAPAMELKTFAKTALLEAGESCTVTMSIPAIELGAFDEASSSWLAPEGSYTLVTADGSENVTAAAQVSLRKTLRQKVSDVLHPEGELFIGTYPEEKIL